MAYIGGHLCIRGGGLELAMTEQYLYQRDIDLLFEQVGGERMPQQMHRDPLFNLSSSGCRTDGTRQLSRT
jgi:hypothetical protein